MNPPAEYKIVSGAHALDLEKHVNMWIHLGWEPHGSLVYIKSGLADFSYEYRQPMVRRVALVEAAK